jgi:AcrR family transcriptional regulator
MTKTPNKQDRRVQRTHRLLHDAFISLILERGYDAVSIRDVVQRAGVGRSTFYIHFGDLDELLFNHTDGNWLREFGAHPDHAGAAFAFTRPFLEHALEYRRLWRAMVGKKAGHGFQKRLKQNVLILIREDVAQLTGRQRPDITECQARYLTGAFTELVFGWLDAPNGVSPAQLDELFKRLTAGALGISPAKFERPVRGRHSQSTGHAPAPHARAGGRLPKSAVTPRAGSASLL